MEKKNILRDGSVGKDTDARPGNLSLILNTHIVENKTDFYKLPFGLHTGTVTGVCVCTYMKIIKINKYNFKN